MWNTPTLEDLTQLSSLYETENIPLKEKVIGMHFLLGSCDWYAAEYNSADRLFFGYAILNNTLSSAEWGYFSLDELRQVSVQGLEIDRDLHWKPRPAYEVKKIRRAHEMQGLW